MTLILRHRISLRQINVVTWSLLCVTLIASVVALETQSLSSLPGPIRILISPFLHADYLHLCLNILGSFLVIGRLEECNGARLTSSLLLITYFCQVTLVALTVYVIRIQIDILGISCLVFASLGHIVQQNFRRSSRLEKNTLVSAMVMMVIFEESLRTIIVHSLALTFGVTLALLKNTSNDYFDRANI